jgi:NADH-quinone oxidoreductase subunit H
MPDFLPIFDQLFPILIKIVFLLIPLLVAVAYLTLAERKIIGAMQLRVGPNSAGIFGILQPIADAIKLLRKELIIPSQANKFLFILAPVITFGLAISGWAVVPIDKFKIADINPGILYLLAISSLGVYGVILAGWASNSRYAFLGAIRSAAQMISYELTIGLVILSLVLVTGSLNLTEIVLMQQKNSLYLDLLLLPLGIVFFIAILAETNRHPFDLPEAESELVAGYHVEYSSMAFALFFLGEYANMILMSAMTSLFFLGAWFPPFGLAFLDFLPPVVWFSVKIAFCLFIFIWVRAALPRYRYDQLMRIGWKFLLPFTLFWFILLSFLVRFSTI